MAIGLNFLEGILGLQPNYKNPYDLAGTVSRTAGGIINNAVEKSIIENNNNEITPEKENTDIKKEEEKAEDLLQEAYQREDEIRKETQEREDTAYQRAVEDMQKAGINPNIFTGASAAASGGGITHASRADLTLVKAKYEAGIQMLMQQIANEFNADQKTKDRLTSMANNIMQIINKN